MISLAQNHRYGSVMVNLCTIAVGIAWSPACRLL